MELRLHCDPHSCPHGMFREVYVSLCSNAEAVEGSLLHGCVKCAVAKKINFKKCQHPLFPELHLNIPHSLNCI